MKISTLLLTVLFLFVFQVQQAYSQNEKINHTFKIVGPTQLKTSNGVKTVDYDPESSNHLYISEFNVNGTIVSKRQFLFSGKKFNLSVNYLEYLNKKEIIIDGLHSFYNNNGSIQKSLEYQNDILVREYYFYPNGQKQSMLPGIDVLNGEYKQWHSNGQLSFSGLYNKNLKDGEFQQFDESGALVKKGVYSGGKLISGEAVVQDINFEMPDKLANYSDGDKAFNDYLRGKTSELKCVKELGQDIARSINLKMTIDKRGGIQKIDILSNFNPTDSKALNANATNVEILNAAFGDFHGFNPATVEEVPVTSKLDLKLILTKEGLQKRLKTKADPALQDEDSLDDAPYSFVEQMPEFTGGEMALRKYLGSNVRYPREAMENGFQGKVFVSYIVEKDGSITNVKIQIGIHPLLDAEAIRVVQGMPRWIPGRQSGKTVRVSYTVPINFVLE